MMSSGRLSILVLSILLVNVLGLGLSEKPVFNVCDLPKDAGPCMALLPRWWYDKATDTCTSFTYGGCQGNENNFQSIVMCQKICSKTASSS